MEDDEPKILVITDWVNYGIGVDKSRLLKALAKLEHNLMIADLEQMSVDEIQGREIDFTIHDDIVSFTKDQADFLMKFHGSEKEEVEKSPSIGKTLNRGKGKHKKCWDSPYGK